MRKYISIDIGGTAIKYGAVREDGRILSRMEMPTEAEKGGPSVLEKTAAIVSRFTGQESFDGICISTAGMVDTKRGEVFYAAPLIPRYAGTRFKAVLEERFSIPCEVENDVNCAGLAEYISGAGKGSRGMVMLTVGTGIGGCAVIDGNIFHGAGNSAMEVGYMHMRNSDFQSLGAASVLTKKVAAWKREPAKLWDGRRIFQCAREGDEICQKAIEEMTDVLGLGIANICYILNPEIVVLGGGIMAQKEYLKDKMEKAAARYLIGPMAAKVRLCFAEHGNDAGMLGAFYHFMNCRQKINQRESV